MSLKSAKRKERDADFQAGFSLILAVMGALLLATSFWGSGLVFGILGAAAVAGGGCWFGVAMERLDRLQRVQRARARMHERALRHRQLGREGGVDA